MAREHFKDILHKLVVEEGQVSVPVKEMVEEGGKINKTQP